MKPNDSKEFAAGAVARSILAEPHGAMNLESVWSRAGAESVLSGRLTDPPITTLKELTFPDRAWDNQPWPSEHVLERGQCLSDCHLLAIAVHDCAWLQQMHQVWEDAPVAFEWRLLSQLQIGLGLRPQGLQPRVWTQDDSDFLIEADALERDTPAGRAWVALAAGDARAAQIAVGEYRAELERWQNGWNDAVGEGVRRILGYPGRVLRVELRALQALLSGV